MMKNMKDMYPDASEHHKKQAKLHYMAVLLFIVMVTGTWLMTNMGWAPTNVWDWLGPIAVGMGALLLLADRWYSRHNPIMQPQKFGKKKCCGKGNCKKGNANNSEKKKNCACGGVGPCQCAKPTGPAPRRETERDSQSEEKTDNGELEAASEDEE